MCLRAEKNARIADKTVLKMMREMGKVAAFDAKRRQKKLKGLTPEEFRNQSLMAA